MPTKAIAAIGTLIKMGDSATPTETFTTISEVRDIDGPKMTASTIDVTNHSTVGAFEEFIPGFLSAGTIDFEMNHIISDDVQNDLEAAYLARDRFNIQIVLPEDVDSTPEADRTSQMQVFVASMGRRSPVKGALTRNVSLQVVGAPTLGLGS